MGGEEINPEAFVKFQVKSDEGLYFGAIGDDCRCQDLECGTVGAPDHLVWPVKKTGAEGSLSAEPLWN